MRLKLPIDISNISVQDEDLVRAISQIFDSLTTIINGEVSFTDNCKTTLVTIIFNTKDVEQAVMHTLKRVPLGYIQVGSKVAAQVYNGNTTNTPQVLYLKSTVATTVSLLIF